LAVAARLAMASSSSIVAGGAMRGECSQKVLVIISRVGEGS
jgi:hypothetical protein